YRYTKRFTNDHDQRYDLTVIVGVPPGLDWPTREPENPPVGPGFSLMRVHSANLAAAIVTLNGGESRGLAMSQATFHAPRRKRKVYESYESPFPSR
ncbi:unnamed protein product, partial [Ranitomeya imitator]